MTCLYCGGKGWVYAGGGRDGQFKCPKCNGQNATEHVTKIQKSVTAADIKAYAEKHQLSMTEARKALIPEAPTVNIRAEEYMALLKNTNRYRYLLHNMGTVEAHARTWMPAKHKPLMEYLQDFIDYEIGSAT